MKFKSITCFLFLSLTLCRPAVSANKPPAGFDEGQFVTQFFWNKFSKLPPSERPRIALVLGGGGARGLAHIGVLKVFEEEGIPVDVVVGTSVGALVGSLYSAGVPMETIEKIGENTGWNDLTDVSDAALVKLLLAGHLLSTEKMESFIGSTIGHKRFDEMNIPFACLATDLITGERIILREGEVAPAVRASATIPGIFDPVEYRHRYLVDGGLNDNIPVDVAKLLGADFIIAVAVAADFSKNDVSSVYMVLTQSLYIQGRLLDAEKLKAADFVIKPKVSNVSTVDLGRSKDCIEAGITAAHECMPALKTLLLERASDKYLFK